MLKYISAFIFISLLIFSPLNAYSDEFHFKPGDWTKTGFFCKTAKDMKFLIHEILIKDDVELYYKKVRDDDDFKCYANEFELFGFIEVEVVHSWLAAKREDGYKIEAYVVRSPSIGQGHELIYSLAIFNTET